MTEREQLQALVDDLPDEEVHAALRFVSYLRAQQDSLLAALASVEPPTLRLRVGSWRVLFRLAPDRRVLLVLRVRPRGSAYR